MGVDPLSPSTRTAKRNLLLASTIAITYSAFDVSVSKIPVGGLAIEFDSRVFAFLLFVVLLYFTATFALYYFIDIRNVEPTKHQSGKESGYQLARDYFWSNYARKVLTKIEKSLPKGVVCNTSADAAARLGKFIKETETPFFEENMIDHFVHTMSNAMGLAMEKTTARDSPNQISREENTKLYEDVETQLRKAFVQFRRKKRINDLLLLPSLYAVRFLYFIRNYLVDGALPFMLAAVALAAILQLIDLHWLRSLTPAPRAA